MNNDRLPNVNNMLKAASKGCGTRTTYQHDDNVMEVLSALNSIAKLFYKVGSAGSYIATIIQAANDCDDLLLSFPGVPQDMAMTNENIDLIKKCLLKLLSKNVMQKKFELFQAMYVAGNDLVIQLFINLQKNNKITKKEEQDTLNALIQWKKCTKDDSRKNFFNTDLFQNVFKENFTKLLEDEDIKRLGNFFKDKQINVFPHDTKKHNGMHVEAKGVAYYYNTYVDLDSNKEKYTSFNIGLATKFGSDIGCCGACTVEFNVINDKIYSVNRTADFLQNFPQGNYSTSDIIKKDNTLYIKFIRELIKACDNVDEMNRANDKYYFQYKSELLKSIESAGQSAEYNAAELVD